MNPIRVKWRNKSKRGAIDQWARLPTMSPTRMLARTDVLVSILAEVLDVTKAHAMDIAVMAMVEQVNQALVENGITPIDIEAWSRESDKVTRRKRHEYIPVAERAKNSGAQVPRKRTGGRKVAVQEGGGQGGGAPVPVRGTEAHQGPGGG